MQFYIVRLRAIPKPGDRSMTWVHLDTCKPKILTSAMTGAS
jgi:hypothetical protein